MEVICLLEERSTSSPQNFSLDILTHLKGG